MKNEEKDAKTPSNNEPFRNVLKSMDDFFNAKPLRGAMDSIDEFLQRPFVDRFPVDLYETSDELVITAEIPGVRREDIYVDVVGTILKISIEHQEVNEVKHDTQNFYRRKRFYHHAERHVKLPYPISEKQIKATYRDGILEIKAPKGQRRKSQIKIDE